MASIRNITSNTNKLPPVTFAAVEKQHGVLSNVLSFLTPKEQKNERLVSHKHDIVATQISKKPVIENGYGDFLLVDMAHDAAPASLQSYKDAFPILNKYLAQVGQKPEKNRLQKVNQLLQHKLPHLKAIFIPRVLYELFYLLQGYDEELQLAKKNRICPKNDLCCHGFVFRENKKNLDLIASYYAYALNRFIIDEIGHIDGCLTVSQYQRIGKILLDRIEKLNQELIPNENCINKKDTPILMKMRQGIMIDQSNLDKIIKLECSRKSENAVILYRGASTKKEPLYKSGSPYAASFGISLFAGYIHDVNACAAGRIFYESKTKRSYALVVPLVSNWKDAFDIPPVNTICGLSGKGELFHARAKCLKPVSNIEGFEGDVTPEIEARLVSQLTKKELQKKLKSFQTHSITISPDPSRKKGDTAFFI